MKNIVICANVDQDSYKTFSEIEKHVDLSDANVTILHVWTIDTYSLEGVRVVAYYPNEAQAEDISKKKKEALMEQKERFKTVKKENFNVEVLTAESPKRATVEYLRENKADLVVCLTPQKEKLRDYFHSSFTSYLASHAPCDLLMIRQR